MAFTETQYFSAWPFPMSADTQIANHHCARHSMSYSKVCTGIHSWTSKYFKKIGERFLSVMPILNLISQCAFKEIPSQLCVVQVPEHFKSATFSFLQKACYQASFSPWRLSWLWSLAALCIKKCCGWYSVQQNCCNLSGAHICCQGADPALQSSLAITAGAPSNSQQMTFLALGSLG